MSSARHAVHALGTYPNGLPKAEPLRKIIRPYFGGVGSGRGATGRIGSGLATVGGS